MRNYFTTSFIKKALFPIAFCCILFLPLFAWIVDINVEVKINEKRALAKKPIYELGKPVKKYLASFDEYFKDNFPLRTALIFLNNYIKFFVFSTSPNPDVVVGNSKMLFFFSKNSGDPLGDFRGLNSFDAEQLKTIKLNLEKRRDLLRAKKIHFVLLLAPNKESIYPENVPAWISKYKNQNRLDQLSEYLRLNSDLSVVAVKQDLLEEKKYNPVYYYTDSHWNQFGSFIVYDKLMKQISLFDSRVPLDDKVNYKIEKKIKNIRGDLSTLLGLQEILEDVEVQVEDKDVSKDVELDGVVLSNLLEPHNYAFESKLKNRPNVVFLCDSFMFYGPVRFLKRKLGNSYYIWHSLPNDPVLLKNEKIDIMVFEVVERYLPMLLNPMKEEKYPWTL